MTTNEAAFNEHMRPVEPTFGCVMLASLDADEIAHELRLAQICASNLPRDMGQYEDRVRAAQLRLGELARRLGYELTPTTSEPVDA